MIIASRKADHGEEAVAKIKESADGPVDIRFVELDLGNLKAVKQVADEFAASEERLDLVSPPRSNPPPQPPPLTRTAGGTQLIADAGIGVNAFALDADGVDRHMGVNHFGHFLLINRLLPLVRRTAARADAPAPRIVAMSSELHKTAPASVKFASTAEVYTNEQELGPNALYARTKLAVLLNIKYGLVERVIVPNGDRIWAAATHPGAVHTDQQVSASGAFLWCVRANQCSAGPIQRGVWRALGHPDEARHHPLHAHAGAGVSQHAVRSDFGRYREERLVSCYLSFPR